ncbi:glycosyltransferase family 4 protein [Paenibacillus alkaliterrae]|uniref:glycosyltransferase family 4 protein n=1 Tax=Paenibacillus alkaliterrae TaxID=320909 RepID=UPI001F27AE46|nr:glycosyltransferase family 4 protein [Paenibacillus alkaliterrae]MCF2939556.1 glycosyltransferase family 4 protein [Paenibacillus alkaliterrae]
MRLAFVCTEKLPAPAVKGGAIQMMMDGVSPILARKHQLTVYTVTDETLPDQEIRGGIKYIRFPRERYVEEVSHSLKEHVYDVVHVFNRPRNVIPFKTASPASRFVLSLHNEMFAVNKISDTEAKLCVQYVYKITTVSNYIKKTVTDRIPEAENKIEPIYSGFDPNAYYPIWTARGSKIREQLRNQYGVNNKKVILFVGRLSVKKGPHLLIQAMDRVLEQHPDAVLVIVGGKWFSDNAVDDYGKWLLQLAEPYRNRVIFTKFVPANEIQNYFSMADVFVCSSQWQEPLARVHYEAMAAGVPIVTTDRGGNAEVITHKNNGYIVRDYTSASSFADAVNYMLTNKNEAAAMAVRGRQLVDSNFTFEHVAQRLNKIYMEAYSSKPTPLSNASVSRKKQARTLRSRKERKTATAFKRIQHKGR